MNTLITSAALAISVAASSPAALQPPAPEAPASATSALPRRPGPLGVRLAAEGEALGVAEVVPGSVAAKAGIMAGDTILSVAGTPVTSRETMGARLRTLAAGDTVSIEMLDAAGRSIFGRIAQRVVAA